MGGNTHLTRYSYPHYIHSYSHSAPTRPLMTGFYVYQCTCPVYGLAHLVDQAGLVHVPQHGHLAVSSAGPPPLQSLVAVLQAERVVSVERSPRLPGLLVEPADLVWLQRRDLPAAGQGGRGGAGRRGTREGLRQRYRPRIGRRRCRRVGRELQA